MSTYLIVGTLLLMGGVIAAMFIKNMAMERELSKLRARTITLELERDRQIRAGVFK